MPISQQGKGILAASSAAFCAGTATVLSKDLLAQVSPFALLALQLLASCCVLWLVLWFKRRHLPNKQQALAVASLGLLEPWLAYLLGLIGLQYLSASGSTLIQSLEALMIAILAFFLLHERVSKRFILLSFLALFGVSLALGLWQDVSASNSWQGVLLLLAATASAALYVVLSSRIAGQYDSFVMVALQHSMALGMAILTLPLEFLFSTNGIQIPQTLNVWLLVMLSGIIQYALAFSLYLYALTKISASLSGSFLTLIPVFGVTMAYLVLGEQLTLVQLLGVVLVVGAVSFMQKV